MSVVGLITEYNPFHKGHVYHIEEAKKVTGSDTVIAVMSGNFVQRGEPAIMDKYTRTHSALDNDVDLVAELPVYYACSSAEGFAFGSVMTLHHLGADFLCFGSECGDIQSLTFIASVLSNEPTALSLIIKELTAEGLSYPTARSRALMKYFKDVPDALANCSQCMTCEDIENILTSPNNILGIEYIKIILKYGLNIKPVTIKRIGGGYHDKNINTSFPSASAIRALLSSPSLNDLERSLTQTQGTQNNQDKLSFTGARNLPVNENTETDYVLNHSLPCNVLAQFKKIKNISFPVIPDDFSIVLNTILRKILYTDADELMQYKDVTPALANRIKHMFTSFDTFTEFCTKLKNKQWTYSRISRILIHIILEITVDKANVYETKLPYVRLLGFGEKGRRHLSGRKKMLKESQMPIITKTADYKELLKDDVYACDLYNMAVYNKFGTKIENEFQKGIIIKTKSLY